MLRDYVSLAVDKPDHVQTDFAIRNAWAVVPFDAGSLYTQQVPGQISAAAQAIGCTECCGFAVEPLLNVDSYRVAMTTADLVDFARVCGHFKYVLVPYSKDFLILCNFVADYCVMCGKRNFVEASLGRNIVEARKVFFEWAENFDSDDPLRSFLLDVSRRYDGYNGS